MNDGVPEEDDHASVRHERSDVEARGILLFAVGLVVIIAGTVVGVVWLVGSFARDAQRRQPIVPPRGAEARREMPPRPRLEGLDLEHSEHDVGRIWAEGSAQEQVKGEEERLRGYGWVERGAGRAHIPIEEAIKLLAARQPTGVPAPPEQFWQEPSSASSGRTARGGQP